MMEDNDFQTKFKLNNVRVTHGSHAVSIAQHREFQADGSDIVFIHEIAILPKNSHDWVILNFDNNLDSLIETLQNVRDIIETRKDVEND